VKDEITREDVMRPIIAHFEFHMDPIKDVPTRQAVALERIATALEALANGRPMTPDNNVEEGK